MNKLPLIALSLLVGACSSNQMLVVAPNGGRPAGAVSAQQDNVARHCVSADDATAGYHTPIPTIGAGNIPSAEAKAAHVNGCAAVKFQLTSEGKAINITLLREYPADYGFGASIIDQVQRSTYTPPASPNSWFFINTATKFGN